LEENLKILNETNKYVLGHIFENVYLIDKNTNIESDLGQIYGDPSCGLIDIDNKWCVVGGSTIIIWTPKETNNIQVEELNWACRIRQKDQNSVQILIDPWSDSSSIWELNIINKTYFKISDFTHYKDRKYTEQIDW
jgi:hypothetical protein